MTKFFTAVLFCAAFLTVPAGAQQYDSNGEVIEPEGARGRYTEEQAQVFALKRLWGEVMEIDGYWKNSRFYHEYTIQTADGSIYEVEVNAQTGDIYQVEVESLSENPRFPSGLVDGEYVSAVAHSYVEEHGKGGFKAKVSGGPALEVFQRKLVYRVPVKKSVRDYAVLIDAFDGSVVQMEEQK